MFKRLSNLIKGFVGLFVSNAERANPEALLEVEKENLRSHIARYNQGLATHAALCEQLMSQVKTQEKQERDLRAQTSANLTAGNRERAGQLAMQLQSVSSQLTENRSQLESAEATYKDLVKARNITVEEAKSKIEKLKFAIGDLKVKKATAEMTEMASGMITSIGGSGDTLNRLQEMVEEDRQKAAGRARVARDSLNTTDFQIKETEQKALADQALADFAAKEGIALEPSIPSDPIASDSPSISKTMGQERESSTQ